uniref:Uncharacterized protein n=1 Tax=Globodera rostochiensis TaxID=31243 RepID=A0A914HCY1_GLORO
MKTRPGTMEKFVNVNSAERPPSPKKKCGDFFASRANKFVARKTPTKGSSQPAEDIEFELNLYRKADLEPLDTHLHVFFSSAHLWDCPGQNRLRANCPSEVLSSSQALLQSSVINGSYDGNKSNKFELAKTQMRRAVEGSKLEEISSKFRKT